MARSMMVNGSKIARGDMESLYMRMEMCIKDIGCITKPMDKACIMVKMDAPIKEIGKKICSMVMEWSLGRMVVCMKDNFCKEKSQALVSIFGQMGIYIKANGVTICFTGKELKY